MASATNPISSREEIVELVTDYLEGVLDPEMAAEVQAHLELCDGCATYVEQMRATIQR
jgi:anti-sigma factor RsiW